MEGVLVENRNYELGKDIDEKMHKIHEIRVDGCGQRNSQGWQNKGKIIYEAIWVSDIYVSTKSCFCKTGLSN